MSDKLKRIFCNRNLIIVGVPVFVLWIAFIDDTSLLSLQNANTRIANLEEEKQFYISKIKEDSVVIEGLKDSAFVERFARETFYMKKDNEEMYVVK